MKRTEALNELRQQWVPPFRANCIGDLHQSLEVHLDELHKHALHVFTEGCSKALQMQRLGRKGKIGHIHITFFRNRIIRQDFRCRIYWYDQALYADPLECFIEYDASWAFRYLMKFNELSLQESKKYIGKILDADLLLLMRQEASLYMHYITNLFRQVMKVAVEQETFLQLDKEEELYIRSGEHRDFNELIYKYNACVPVTEDIRQKLIPNELDEYVHGNFRNIDLSDMYFKLVNLCYAYFTHTNLSGSLLVGCPLIGADFRNAKLSHANFGHSLIHGADFGGADLSGAQFEEVQASYVKPTCEEFHIPAFSPTRFERADLTNAIFVNADLRGADFKGALFEGTSFVQCRLDGAHFLEKDLKTIKLSSEQREGLKIYS
ncbi:pentapeptide repeat-containing protein [Paenibacillus taichungensis]